VIIMTGMGVASLLLPLVAHGCSDPIRLTPRYVDIGIGNAVRPLVGSFATLLEAQVTRQRRLEKFQLIEWPDQTTIPICRYHIELASLIDCIYLHLSSDYRPRSNGHNHG
jgi:hypothetical protein